MRRAWPSYAIAVVVVLSVLSLPVLHLRFGGFDERVLPADSGPRVAAEALARDFPGLASFPIEVLAEGAARRRPCTWRAPSGRCPVCRP